MKCSATTKAGRPCRRQALKGSEPPLCPAHARTGIIAVRREASDAGGAGFYGRNYSSGEIADLQENEVDQALADEINAVRITTRRIMEQFTETLEPAEHRRLARLILDGANTVARLLQAKRALSGDSTEELTAAIAQALDELSDELGIPV